MEREGAGVSSGFDSVGGSRWILLLHAKWRMDTGSHLLKGTDMFPCSRRSSTGLEDIHSNP